MYIVMSEFKNTEDFEYETFATKGEAEEHYKKVIEREKKENNSVAVVLTEVIESFGIN